MKLISACLVGVNCRYNGKSKPNDRAIALLAKGEVIPVCPEQLGGLATPREPSEQRGGTKVLTKSGKDVTKEFEAGAEEALKIAKLCKCEEAVLKTESPSCGCGRVYDGTFTGKLRKGDGVFCELLKKNGIKCITEDELK